MPRFALIYDPNSTEIDRDMLGKTFRHRLIATLTAIGLDEKTAEMVAKQKLSDSHKNASKDLLKRPTE